MTGPDTLRLGYLYSGGSFSLLQHLCRYRVDMDGHAVDEDGPLTEEGVRVRGKADSLCGDASADTFYKGTALEPATEVRICQRCLLALMATQDRDLAHLWLLFTGRHVA